MPAVSIAPASADLLVPRFEACGYSDAHIQRPFQVDRSTIPVAGFAGRPFDSWSSCVAAVNLNGDSKASAAQASALGVPTVFVCGPQGVDWWAMGPQGPTTNRPIAWDNIDAVFHEHKADLAPSRIYDAKLRRPQAARQLWFFDVGLMPAVETNRGRTLLRLVEDAMRALHEQLGARLNTRQAQEDAYRTVFWLLAAKVLHDKRVENFIQIDLGDIDRVFNRIGKHHGATGRFPPFGKQGRPAIEEVAKTFAACGSLADVSSESIAYVYENALVPKAAGGKRGEKHYDIRRELGIHSTPSVLIQHMLSQMWSMVEEIPRDERHVFEPACGHAPFLTAAMRLLRLWGENGESTKTHTYLRSHLHGVEADAFALELARLALTLADEPHGNRWHLTQSDMFLPGVLAKHSRKARILLANPPYEGFTSSERAYYANQGEQVTAHTKAAEMLLRTLPHLPAGAVFGVVVPQGVLYDSESKPVRELLLADFELAEIGVFADNLFEHGDHEAATLIGRRKVAGRTRPSLQYRRVREHCMQAFKERIEFSSQQLVSQDRFTRSAGHNFRVPELDEIWDYLSALPTLSLGTSIQKGFEFQAQATLKSRKVISTTRRDKWPKAVLQAADEYSVWQLPKRVWVDMSGGALRRAGAAVTLGTPQVLLNYAPVARKPWRLKAVIDREGLAISSRFLAFRPKPNGPTLPVLWAVLNSPVANAYGYCTSGKQQTLVSEWRQFPMPRLTPEQSAAIESAAAAYLEAVEADEAVFMKPQSQQRIKRALLRLDAEVLRIYNLPPRLERMLLDLFTGIERKGVGCDFRGYYPPGFTSFLPLHFIISEDFARAAADVTIDRFQPGESAYVRDVLVTATEAFAQE